MIAFAPGWLGTPLESEHQRHTRYSDWCWSDCNLLVLTGIYIWRANGEFDRLNNEDLLHEVQAS